MTEETSGGTGLKKETAAALATLLGPTLIVPILFILLEKDEYVRFWAFQSIIVNLALFVLNSVMLITIILAALTPLVFVLGIILWLTMTYKAWQGERWTVPVVGKFTERFMKRV